MLLPLMVRWAIHVLPSLWGKQTEFIPRIVRRANNVSSPHCEMSKPCFFPALRGEQTMLFPLILRWNHVSSPHSEMSKPSSLIFRLSYSKGCCYKRCGWVAMARFVARLLATADHWLRIQTSLKIQNGRHKQGVANT
jgi:hypothetical protein